MFGSSTAMEAQKLTPCVLLLFFRGPMSPVLLVLHDMAVRANPAKGTVGSRAGVTSASLLIYFRRSGNFFEHRG